MQKLILLIALICLTTKGDIPSISKIKVNDIKGIVKYKEEVIENAKISIAPYEKEELIVGQSITDKAGYFEINGIKPGKYWLSTETNVFVKHYVIVNVEDNHKHKNSYILIIPADIQDFCCDVKIISNN